LFFSLAKRFFDVIALAIAEKNCEANGKKSFKDAYLISWKTS